MKILIDTQVWLWALESPERLDPRIRKTLEDPRTEIFLSAASIWEICIKHRIGKLRLPCSPEEYVLSRIQEERFTELPISARHALRVSALPDHHRDPFDRILIAQSLGEGIPLLTADRQLAKYDAEILWADGEQRR